MRLYPNMRVLHEKGRIPNSFYANERTRVAGFSWSQNNRNFVQNLQVFFICGYFTPYYSILLAMVAYLISWFLVVPLKALQDCIERILIKNFLEASALTKQFRSKFQANPFSVYYSLPLPQKENLTHSWKFESLVKQECLISKRKKCSCHWNKQVCSAFLQTEEDNELLEIVGV